MASAGSQVQARYYTLRPGRASLPAVFGVFLGATHTMGATKSKVSGPPAKSKSWSEETSAATSCRSSGEESSLCTAVPPQEVSACGIRIPGLGAEEGRRDGDPRLYAALATMTSCYPVRLCVDRACGQGMGHMRQPTLPASGMQASRYCSPPPAGCAHLQV